MLFTAQGHSNGVYHPEQRFRSLCRCLSFVSPPTPHQNFSKPPKPPKSRTEKCHRVTKTSDPPNTSSELYQTTSHQNLPDGLHHTHPRISTKGSSMRRPSDLCGSGGSSKVADGFVGRVVGPGVWTLTAEWPAPRTVMLAPRRKPLTLGTIPVLRERAPRTAPAWRFFSPGCKYRSRHMDTHV